MDRILLYGFLEELETFDEDAVEAVVKEVADEMFLPENKVPEEQAPEQAPSDAQPAAPAPASGETRPDVLKDVTYYKAMLTELTDALDDAISHKIKLTRYIDKLLKKKYKTYVRLKSDD